jgi:hypothetical protein
MTRLALEKLIARESLTRGEAADLMRAIMAGDLTDAQVAGILIALRAKGETVEEITGFVTAMRERSIKVLIPANGTVDTCGTGGDSRRTFNISTATALVAAGMGITVAKHGNRAISSKCGSADVLEALGVNIDLPPDKSAELIERVGIGFLFAPHHHPAMKHAATARRELGLRTVFNLLGPMTNPDRNCRPRPGRAGVGARVRGPRPGRERRGVGHGADAHQRAGGPHRQHIRIRPYDCRDTARARRRISGRHRRRKREAHRRDTVGCQQCAARRRRHQRSVHLHGGGSRRGGRTGRRPGGARDRLR